MLFVLVALRSHRLAGLRRADAERTHHLVVLVFDYVARLVKEYGAPQYIRSDNGSEFIEKG
jgi:hypothetical protein